MKKILSFLFILSFMSCLVFAQDVPPVADVAAPAAQSPMLLIIAALVPLVIQFVKLIVPALPKWTLPIIAPLLGMLADYIGSRISGGTATPLVGAALGLVGVGVRELIDQVGGRIVNGKANVVVLLLLASLSFGTSGCAWFHPQDLKPAPVAEGQDSVVVNAERVQKTSLFAYTQLTEFELANRAALPVQFSRVVDQVRSHFKPNWEASRKALEDYKTKRGVSLDDVNRITAALSAAQSAMLDLRGSQDAGAIASVVNSISRLANNINQLRQPVIPSSLAITNN